METKIYKKVPNVLFYQIKGTNSKITCFNNVSPLILSDLNEVYGVNMLVYSLEDGKEINTLTRLEKYCNDIAVEFHLIRFPFFVNFANFKDIEKNFEVFLRDISTFYESLKQSNWCCFIHCAPGVFKQSILVYCLLRMSGETKDEALTILLNLRGEKRNGVGDVRILFTERYLVPLLLSNKF